MGTTNKDKRVEDVEEGEHAEGPVAPLVGRLGEGANETSDDHDLIGQNGDENGGSRDASGQEEVEQEKRGGDKPVEIAYVEDLASTSSGDVDTVGAGELDLNRDLTEASAHTEVGNGSNQGDGGSDIVE